MTPYLIVGLAWFAFLMLAFKVRMIEPVFLWVFTQGLIVEMVLAREGLWAARPLLFGAYMAAAILAWFLVELGGRNPRHVWRRAILAWIGIQTLYCLIATFLVYTGVIHE